MADPTHSRRLFLFAAGLILAGAACLRFQQINQRPFHADEGVQAYQTWRFLRGDGYTYDPADKHGPFLYYAAASIARLSGWSPAALDEIRLRSITLLAGLGTLALLLAAATRLGRGPVLIGSAVLATAPLAVIYDTYFVQEAWFCFFSWGLFFATLRLVDEPTLARTLLVGVVAGLMQATKETSVLHFAALGIALAATRPLREFGRLWPQLLTALVTTAAVYVLFYSAFFTHWSGVADGLRSYLNYAIRAGGGVHDQPWSYYFSMLWLNTRAGTHWGEPLLLILALGGTILAFTARAIAFHRAIAVFTLALLTIYSAIPYKMPWLLLTPYVGLALLAGFGATLSAGWLPPKVARYAPAFLGLALVIGCVLRDGPALGRYANDERNPYVYQPTAPDLSRLVAAILASPAAQKIAVVSPDHAWPLPWYLRDQPATGYFTVPPDNLGAFDIVLLDSRLAAPPPPSATPFGLRPNVMLWHAPR